MAVKSVLDVEVHDEAFKKLRAAFAQYRADVKAMPKETAKVGGAWASVTAMFKRGAVDAKAQAASQRDMVASAKTIDFHWGNIARKTKSAADSIYRSTASFARASGITAVAGGLLGAGGIMGIESLAAVAAAGRRNSQGLGMSFGQQQAFSTTYGRIVDPGSFLGGISQGKGNISSGAAAAMFMLGVNPTDREDTGSAARRALSSAHAMAQGKSDFELGILHQSKQLDNLFSLEDMRRLRDTSPEDFAKYQADDRRRTSSLGVDDSALKKWQDFTVAMDEAGKKIRNTLIDGLSALADPLGKLAIGLSATVKSLLDSDGFKDVIKAIASGLESFAKYIGDGKFKKDVSDFAEGFGALAEWVADKLRMFGILPDKTTPGGSTVFGPAAPPMSFEDFQKQKYGYVPGKQWPDGSPRAGLYEQRFGASNGMGALTGGMFGGLVGPHPFGGPADWRNAISGNESGGRYNALGPMQKNGDRAYGKYQVMGSNIGSWTEKALGRRMTPQEFLADEHAQDAVFDKIFGDYVKQYGNPQDAASAWFSGRPRSQVSGSTTDSLGTSVDEYVRRFNNGMSRVAVTINNNTGGSAIASVAQMAPSSASP